MNRIQVAKVIDHILLKAFASEEEMKALCEEAVRFSFRTVSVNPVWVAFCKKQLQGSSVGIDACIGFPLGANTAHMKVEETRDAISNGATEIDMVINIGAVKSGYGSYVEREIAAVVKAAGTAPVKVILETSYLTHDEKVEVCRMSVRAGAAYVKTSTGFGTRGATVDDVRLMRETVGDRLGVKAAGGIRSYGDVMRMLRAGATRIGTSAGVAIVEDAPGS